MSKKSFTADQRCKQLLRSLKQKVVQSQHRAAMSVNSRLIYLYWQIGLHILHEQDRQGWGTKVIEQLAQDLSRDFPDMQGLSSRNMVYMRQFANEWPVRVIAQQLVAQLKKKETEFTQQAVAQLEIPFETFSQHPISKIPWSHHTVLMDKLDHPENRLFYCRKIIENNWSRKTLLNQLEQKLHEQQGALAHNFEKNLPEPQSELAQDTFKDPYFFDFLQLGEEAKEREIEERLIQQITRFLLELGAGFAYMGRQYKLEVGGKEYFLDLLFYHTKLKCYVLIELKIGEFQPEHAGKVQFYLSALDEQVKDADDQSSIGLILCKEANRITAEYALKDSSKPMGVAEYQLVDALPEKLKDQLPDKEEIEEKLSEINDETED